MDTKERQTAHFKELCAEYLNRQSLFDLRGYGRFLNLPRPTDLKKTELIGEILSVLCGEKNPQRTKRGAPIKNNHLNADILKNIEEIKRKTSRVKKVSEQKCRNQRKSNQNDTVVLTFSISFEKLNDRQKQLLNDFLNSL